MQKVYIAFEETSDQFGKSEPIKAFASQSAAEQFISTLKNRGFVREIEYVDAINDESETEISIFRSIGEHEPIKQMGCKEIKCSCGKSSCKLYELEG